MTDSLKDFAAGTVGGFLGALPPWALRYPFPRPLTLTHSLSALFPPSGKLLDYPFDTVKVLLQTQGVSSGSPSVGTAAGSGAVPSAKEVVSRSTAGEAAAQSPATYRGAWHCLTHTVRTRGVGGLYRGISSPLLGSMAENAVLFLSYGELKRALGEVPGPGGTELSLFQLSLAGAGAGVPAAFVLTPFELVKCRLQVQNSTATGTVGGFRAYRGPLDVVLRTLREEGLVRGLYRGNASTLLREVPGNFCWYGTYEGVCKALTPDGGTKDDLGPSAHLIGGASAGVAYWSAFYPADTVKSHVQTHPDRATHGFWETFRRIYKVGGLRALYQGWGITVMRAAPAHAVIFAAYEYTKKLLRPGGGGGDVAFTMHEPIRD